MRRIGGFVLTVTGFLASLLAGTALGSFLTHNTGLVYTGAGIYFVAALALGYWFLFGPARRKRDANAACLPCVPKETQRKQT